MSLLFRAGDVTSDSSEVHHPIVGTETTGNLLIKFTHADIPLSLIVVGGDLLIRCTKSLNPSLNFLALTSGEGAQRGGGLFPCFPQRVVYNSSISVMRDSYMKKLLTKYLKDIVSTNLRGDAREESYYDSLKTLFSDFPLEKERKTAVTVLPKPTEAGNPDFRVWDGDHFIVGYIEAKPPGANLDQVETSEQLKRYLHTFPNLILTDFYEFRLYRDGLQVTSARIARRFTAKTLKASPALENSDQFEALASQFFAFKLPKTFTAENLAVELAKRTRFLRDQVVAEELKESEQGRGDVFGFYKAFKQYLITSLTPEQFADLYSQTITYGLFAARTRVEGDFNRRIAFENIPQTIGILRDVFNFISLGKPSPQMEVIVDDIASVLNAADINAILDQYYRQGKGEDPIVHFYETFLNQYDPATRESRGVYYTPEPVVKYIVKSVHHLLKTRFGLPDGLAAEGVTLLDPAAGTLTFPAEAIKLAVQEYVDKYGEGGRQSFIRDHVLKNYYALELMMAPYAIGHMKISFLLGSLGYKLKPDESFKLYLTNSLEMEEIVQMNIPGISSLSEESHLAGRVKREPILVIMGNPPYSGISSNKNDWTEKLLKTDLDGAQSYYTVDGKPLGERNPKWLQDDYVKFLRLAQWKIQKAGQGIVAMITNHAYLDNPTFRGMRQSLLKTFDEIFILDLHGNSLKKETAPDGGRDENVFDIRQGVAIALFVKHHQPVEQKILHQDLFGTRAEKYAWLLENDFSPAKYSPISADSPYYFFIPRQTKSIIHYLDWMKITDIFPVNSVGIVTSRDKFVIDEEKKILERKLRFFSDLSQPDEIVSQAFNLKDTSSWKLSQARKELSKVTDVTSYIKEILYRPFDKQYIAYHPSVIERMREDVMRHMLEENLALNTVRQIKTGEHWQHCLIANTITESCYVSNRTSEIGYSFPLYYYPDNEKTDLFSQLQTERVPNISEATLNNLRKHYQLEASPEDILYYVYGILFSNVYREKYFEFLKIDLPRIPFTADYDLFQSIAALGQRLVDLHLLKSTELDQPITKYQGQGTDHIITKPRYAEDEQRVYINSNHYFEGISPELWHYQVGGYQVLDKYLKDRKGRPMEDPRYYIRVATSLAKTIVIQHDLDALYPAVEKDLIAF
jgi:predicted helicase